MAELLELTVNMSYAGQLIVNRFHYVGSGTPAAVTMSFGLVWATGFGHVAGSPLVFDDPSVGRLMQTNVHTSTTFVSAYARNLYVPTDFYERPFPSAVYGSAAGDPCAPFLALGAYSNRVRTDIRRGFKRFGGVSESALENGGVLTSGALGDMQNLCNNLSDTLTYDDEGNTLTFQPAIFKYKEYTTPRGRKAYRKYDTKAEQEDWVALGIDWTPYTTARSQVSRQRGRGV